MAQRKTVRWRNALEYGIISAMKNNEYRPRVADTVLREILSCKGAVLVEGPKWCGKTTTAEQVAASTLYMDEPGKKDSNISLAKLNPIVMEQAAIRL